MIHQATCVYFESLVMKDLKMDFMYTEWIIKEEMLTST